MAEGSRLLWFLLLALQIGAAVKPPKDVTPALPPEVLCPEDLMPDDWLERCLGAQLLYSREIAELSPEVGNGYVATIVGSDTIFAAGLFTGYYINNCTDQGLEVNQWCGSMTHKAVIPAYRVEFDALHAKDPKDTWKGGRALDVERAVFIKRWEATSGLLVDERYFAPYQERNMLVHEIKLTNPGDADQTVSLKASCAGQSNDLELRERVGEAGGSKAYQLQGRIKASEVKTPRFFMKKENLLTSMALVANVPPEEVEVPAGKNVTIYSFTVIATSLSDPSPLEKAMEVLTKYVEDDFAKAPELLSKHTEAWEARSREGRLEVQGDLSLAQAVNSSLYYIRTSAREDWPYGLSPGGLASNAYNGHTFWDQETWMYPPMLMLEPKLARALMQYRADRIDFAREKAQACGSVDPDFLKSYPKFQKHGEMLKAFWLKDRWHEKHAYCNKEYADQVAKEALLFSWESALTGIETVYMDARLGPWGMFQQHINGDIAFAARQYWYATGDKDWLKDVGFPLVNGTASFYTARLSERGDGGWDYNVVMGPDEYAFPVKNSAYTNAIVRITLEFAAEAAKELGYESPVYLKWVKQAAGLHMPSSDSVPGRPELKGGYTPEYEGFPNGSVGEDFYLPSPSCDAPNGCVKQADAILLNFPLGFEVDSRTLANDLDFYEQVTDPNGPAMTWAMFAINWLVVGDYERSARMFPRGYANVNRPFGVWTEYPASFSNSGAVNFITGAGGFLQSLVFGTSGMRLLQDSLYFDPPPPSATGTNATRFIMHSFHYLGSQLRQEVTEKAMRFQLLGSDDGSPALCLSRHGHSAKELKEGTAVGMPRGKATIATCGQGGNAEIQV